MNIVNKLTSGIIWTLSFLFYLKLLYIKKRLLFKCEHFQKGGD